MAEVATSEERAMDVNSPDQASEMDVTSPANGEFSVDNTPAQVETHLDFISLNKNGELLLGCSSLTGRYWGGGLWYYKDPQNAPHIEKSNAGYELNAGVAVGAFLDGEKTFMIGQDGGTVEFFQIETKENEPVIVSQAQIEEHHDTVLTLGVTCDGKSALTGSADMCIKVWDVSASLVKRHLSPAHSGQITSLDPHPTHPQVFVSAAMDGNVLLWDLRCEKPASCIYRDVGIRPECVAWIEGGSGVENGFGRLVVGTVGGNIALRDSAKYTHDLASIDVLNRPIYRLLTNPYKTNQVAVCGNDSKVIVIDIDGEAMKIKYNSDKHSDFVRGLAWKGKNQLLSCGWDKAVHEHTIP